MQGNRNDKASNSIISLLSARVSPFISWMMGHQPSVATNASNIESTDKDDYVILSKKPVPKSDSDKLRSQLDRLVSSEVDIKRSR